MKVLFLDIDGVLNSTRSALGLNGLPHDFSIEGAQLFDWVAVGLVRRLCQTHGISIVVSSSWRHHHTWETIGKGLDLPTIDRTPSLPGNRGKEIAHWLTEHPGVSQYAILDDDSDMLPEQLPFFVKTSGFEGLTWNAYERLCCVFGVGPYSGEGDVPTSSGRLRINGRALEWEED